MALSNVHLRAEVPEGLGGLRGTGGGSAPEIHRQDQALPPLTRTEQPPALSQALPIQSYDSVTDLRSTELRLAALKPVILHFSRECNGFLSSSLAPSSHLLHHLPCSPGFTLSSCTAAFFSPFLPRI